MPSRRVVRPLVLACTVLAAACSGGGVDPIVQQMDVTTPTPNMVAVAGSGTSNTLVVTRTNRARGAVRMEATGQPEGATVRFAPNPLPPSDAASTLLSVSVAPTVRPGTYEIVVRALGDGIGDGVRTLQLTVRAP